MKFRIDTAYGTYDEPINKTFLYLDELGFVSGIPLMKLEDRRGSRIYYEDGYIEITTLEQLIELEKRSGCHLLVSTYTEDDSAKYNGAVGCILMDDYDFA